MTARRALLASATVALGLILGATAQLAWGQEPQPQQPGCTQADAMRANLKRMYAERPIAIGVTEKGWLLEVLSTADGATWTITITNPSGVSCIQAAGRGWNVEPMGDPT